MLHRILTLSGGGAKGRAQVEWMYLNEMQTMTKTYEYYNLIVGSSVGAINGAIAATGKVPCYNHRSMFNDMVEQIFKKKPWWKFPKTPLYDKEEFLKLWDELIGLDFRMGQCKTKLMITSVNMVKDQFGNEQTIFFKSWEPKDCNRRLVDVVMYSFSAPLYFGFTNAPGEQRVYGDGGTGSDNLPLSESLLEAEMLGWCSRPDDKVIIDAVGCLYSVDSKKTQYDFVSKENTIQQTITFMNPLQGGLGRAMSVSDQIRRAKYECSRKKNCSFRYWDCIISKDMDKMDGIKYLEAYTQCGALMFKKPLLSVNC